MPACGAPPNSTPGSRSTTPHRYCSMTPKRPLPRLERLANLYGIPPPTTEANKSANQPFEGTRHKVSAHLTQNEALIFEKSSPGKKAYKMPPLDVPEVDPANLLGDAARTDLGLMPELSEIEIIRHFTLSLHLELRHRSRDLSAGQLHDEVQPAGQRIRRPPRGHCRSPSLRPESLSQGRLTLFACCSPACWILRAWMRLRCSRRQEHMESSPASCWSAPTISPREIPVRGTSNT